MTEEVSPQLTPEARAEALALIEELFGIRGEDDPLVDIPMIAKLAGVSDGTPGAWQQRTRTNKERIPFPKPDDARYHDKPQWRAISTIIEGFLIPSGRWPRGSVARLTTRRERPHTRTARSVTDRVGISGLRRSEPEVAQAIEAFHLDDGGTRTVGGWKRRLTAARNALAAKA